MSKRSLEVRMYIHNEDVFMFSHIFPYTCKDWPLNTLVSHVFRLTECSQKRGKHLAPGSVPGRPSRYPISLRQGETLCRHLTSQP
jgi:hypothetical protein